MRLEPRQNIPFWLPPIAPVAAVIFSLVLCSILIAWAGAPVLKSYGLLLKGALGSRHALTETLSRATPLIFTGLAAAVAFRAKLWNIGGEGQLYLGACAATLIGSGAFAPASWVMVPTLFLCGALAGGLFLLFPTILKTRFQIDEVVTTLLLNFVVLLLVNWLVFGPWKDPMAMGWPQAKPIVDTGILPVLVAKSRLHAGFIIALVLSVISWAVIKYTTLGYEIRAVGLNAEAAKFAGIPINRTIVYTALISGGLAGAAGVSEVAGLKGYLTLDLSPGFGYTGIAVAMLAGLDPLGVILSAVFIAMIYVGADFMSRAVTVSNSIADVITAVCLLNMLVSVLLVRYRIRKG